MSGDAGPSAVTCCADGRPAARWWLALMLLSAAPGYRARALWPAVEVERMGTHVFVELFDAPFAQLNSSTSVVSALRAAVAAGGLTVVGELVHEFPVMGISALLLISESHLSIHTWPERGYAAVDLFTCGEATPLPCRPHEPVHFRGSEQGWYCADGSLADPGDGDAPLWQAVQALLESLHASGAMITYTPRGIPRHQHGASQSDEGRFSQLSPPPPSGYGWLGGLESEQLQRPEL